MPTIILRTACGCEKQLAWAQPLMPEVRVPLYRPARALGPSAEAELDDLVALEVRRFARRGFEAGVPVYVEIGEAVADRPRAPRLTGEEWAHAVAKFQRDTVLAQHGEADRDRAQSWVRADLDFLRRHDGAVIIAHVRTQTGLVGAFYPAPSWDASEDCLRFWAAIRALQDPQ